MKDSTRKVKEEDGKIIASNRAFSKKAYQHYLNYKQEYDKKAYRRYSFRIDYKNNDDLIAYINQVPNLNGLLRDMLREKMNNEIEEGSYNPNNADNNE